jgi:hypothetical protein
VRITVQIDRLILDGVELTRAQREQVPAAVQTELARLLAAGPVSVAHRAAARSPVTRIGADVAGAVARALPAARRTR